MTDQQGKDQQGIEHLIRDYFVARDQGWLDPALPSLVKGRMGPAALRQAGATAHIARELAEEQGLTVTAVRSGLAKRNHVQIRGGQATATVTAGTALTWSSSSLAESTLSDSYVVQLEKQGEQWMIMDVAYAPIPSTTTPITRRHGHEHGPGHEHAPGHGHGHGVESLAATGQYDRAAAANYALRWSRTSVLLQGDLIIIDAYNPDYDSARQDNDCTDFASQALHAGGWPIHDGWANDNPVNWSPDLWGPRGPSKTWSVAPWLYDYARNPLRGEELRVWPPEDPLDDNLDIWNLQPGDLIFPDWDPNGHFDGTIDHAMVVSGTYTELGFTEPTYSQHSPHRHNLPLSVGIKIATAPKPPVDPGDGMGGQGRVVKFHPVRVKDTFTID